MIKSQTLDLHRLNPRERQTMSLLALGYRDWEIAEKMAISAQTEQELLRGMITKLGAADRLELAFYAYRNRL